MRIGINGFEAVVPRFGYDSKSGLPNRVGSSEFTFQLVSELSRIDNKNEYVIYIPRKPSSDMPRETENWQYKIITSSKLWTIFGLTRELIRRPKLDLFFSPTHYGPLYTPCPEIISILDLSYKYFPDLFKKKDLLQLNIWGKYSLKKSAKALTISESSKRDIINEYGISEAKIKVIPVGIKENLTIMERSEFNKKYNVKNPYILYVGTLQPRKNIVRLVEAFSKISKTQKELELFIVGRKGWNYDEILNSPKKFEVENKVRFLDSVEDNDLPAFYKNAELFVLPSLYEGFGLPILEAMKYGCPVVTSDISSLPEAGGDAAIYFDPENVEDIMQKIVNVLNDKDLKSRMIRRGHEQIKKFSWEKSAREVLSVFEEVKKNV